MRDIHNNIAVENALVSATIGSNTTTTGLTIDRQGNDGLEFIVQSGTVTDGNYVLSAESGDASDLNDAVAVDAKYILGSGSFAATDDDSVKSIGVANDGKRYARVSIVSTGVTTGGPFSAVAVQAPKSVPA